MPRISIIIAHQNDQRLEDTLLSVLENRPRDCEVIVAHDGSYADPYNLADEVLFVETNASCSVTTKLNEALYAACSPVVHFLCEGIQVTEGWCDGPVQSIARQVSVAVSPLIETTDGRRTICAGLDEGQLASHTPQTVKRNQTPDQCAGPLLAAGFYSRRLLLGLGGLLESVHSSVADTDLALTLSDLGLHCDVDASSCVLGQQSHIQLPRHAGVSGDLASVLAAHQRQSSGVMAGMVGTTKRMLASLLNPSGWAPAIAWGMGLASNRLETEVAERLIAWKRSQQTANASNPSSKMNSVPGASSIRRAA
ncbi:MAG: glycosyltransferase family 2 protein [Pirellulaceae bacterium]|nr:glycosyltransferase family 2 protein [Pirellulaceae bacterium]